MAAMSWVPNSLATIYFDTGQFARAEPFYREDVDQALKSFGAGDSRTAAAMAMLGFDLIKQKKWSQAEPLIRESLAIRAKTQPDAWSTFASRSMLGDALLGQGKATEAEPFIVSGYKGLTEREATIPLAGKGGVADAAERVIRLYDVLGRPDKAAAVLGVTVPAFNRQDGG